MIPSPIKLSAHVYCLAALVGSAGCGREDIQVYHVPKEQAPVTAAASLPPENSPVQSPALQWQTPPGWETLPATDFRIGSFKVTGPNDQQADVSVIPLPGGAGTDLSNINRWRGQVGLEPITEAELPQVTVPVRLSGQPALLYVLLGKDIGILGLMQRRADATWFVKMTGDRPLVEQQQPVFTEFVQSMQFAAEQPPPAAPTGAPAWNAPADWRAVTPGQFLVAKYMIAGPDQAEAAVNISSSPGDGGGVAANVNRWRQQLGLGVLSGEELTQSVQSVGPALFVEMSGTDLRTGKPTALVGALVMQAGQAWFYKLMGDAPVVAAQQAAFRKFVQEVRY